MSDTIRTRGRSTHSPMGKETSLDYASISAQMSFLQGKVLTVVDAAILDERQLKATKDLIKSAFSEQLSWIGELCFPEVRMVSPDQMRANGEDPEKIAAEAEELE